MTAEKSPSSKTCMPVTGLHTRAYVSYIRKVVVDRKESKICSIINVPSFISPRLHGVLD